jgi:hypothetical protein
VSYFHEEQRFSPWLIRTLLLIAVLPVAFVFFVRGVVLSVMIVPLILLAVGVLLAFARLVVDVDREAITVAFHFLWPKRRIRISDVRKAEATKYSPLLDYGGYGVRLGFRGWAFNTSGDMGVLVETNDGSRLMIGSHRPKELEAAIEGAKREQEGRRG